MDAPTHALAWLTGEGPGVLDRSGPGGPRPVTVGRAPGGAVVLTLQGDPEPSLGPLVTHLLDDVVAGQGNLTVVVDLLSVTATHPWLVEALAVAGRRLVCRGGQLRLVDPPGELRWALLGAGLGAWLATTRRSPGPYSGGDDALVRVLSMAAHPARSAPGPLWAPDIQWRRRHCRRLVPVGGWAWLSRQPEGPGDRPGLPEGSDPGCAGGPFDTRCS